MRLGETNFSPQRRRGAKFNSYIYNLLNFLKKHPFAVEAFFEKSVVFTFAVPKEKLEHLIPECLTLDTFEDKYAFIAVAIVSTKNLRPKGFPKFMGNDFFLIGYRVFVRYTNNKGKRLRGLYILKSETNKRKMQFFGNIFTEYNYTSTDILEKTKDNFTEISSENSQFKVAFEETTLLLRSVTEKDNEFIKEVNLPENSPFTDWKQARRFAGPLPFTFTYNEKEKEVLIIQGVRQNWTPMPIEVKDFHFEFLEKMNMKDVVLANAFIIKNVPYYWEKGKIEKWQ